jgi:integrase
MTTPTIKFDEKRNHFYARITLGQDENGKQLRKTFYGHSVEEVQEKLDEYEKTTKDLLPGSEKALFRTYFAKWLEIKKGEMRPRSYRRYESLHDTFIKKAPFANKRLTEVTYSDLRIWYNELQSSGTSAKTVAYLNMLIKASFVAAADDRLTTYNPTGKIRFREDKNNKKARALSRSEQTRLVQHLQHNDHELGELFLIDLATGLRLGEALGLRWTDIDFDEGVVRVRRSLERIKTKNGYIDRESVTKTPSSIRDVPIPTPILGMLERRKKDDNSLVFPDKKTGGYIFNKRPLRHIQRLCEELGLPAVTFHDLRHTYCTRLFEAGVPLKTVQHLLGHSDIAITAAIYTHVMKEVATDAVRKLDELF